MLVSIPNGVRQTRRLYKQEAKKRGTTLRALVERQYLALNRSPLLEQVEAKIRSGETPTMLKVEWTPRAAELLAAISTVVLAVELGL